MNKVVNAVRGVYRGCENIIKLKGLETHRRVWVYKTVIRPFLTYACPAWALITPYYMGCIMRAEYHILRALFAKYRKSNGHFVSYRSRLVLGNLHGVDYQIIKLTRRFLIKLDGTENARVRQDNPGLQRWMHEIDLIRRGLFVPESMMFLDNLGIVQDTQGRNNFYGLKRHARASTFDLKDAINPNGRRGKMRTPNDIELKTISELDPPWKSWQRPQRYADL